MIQANFTVSPSSGYVLATNFTVTNTTTSDNINWKYIWDPGTGELVYNVTNPTFTYNYPNTYNISLTAVDGNGNTSIATQQITTSLAYNDFLTFTQIPDSYANPGEPTATPFQISVISSNPKASLNVDLYAANSLSTPLQYVPSKWNFLTPTWYFTDINSNVVTSLSVVPVPVYINGVVVAVSGTAQFYYIDSMSTGIPIVNNPLLITATLQTNNFSTPYGSNIPGIPSTYSSVYPYPSYANNQAVRAGLIWQVNDLLPSLLKVTANYIDNINPLQYNGIEIPTVITYHGNRSYVLSGACNDTSGILFSYPATNALGKQYPLTLTLSGTPLNTFYTETSPLYVQQTDANGALIGGYVFTSLTSLTSIPSTSITAQTTAVNNVNLTGAFPYPQGLVPNTSVWISNPEQNILNKITLTPYISGSSNAINNFNNSNSLIDGYIKQVNVPPIQAPTTFNYNMTGFSGIYGIAIDPRDYSIVAADAEADMLYRFTNTGILTASYNLYNYDHYNPYQSTFLKETFNVTTPVLSSTTYILDNIFSPSTNPNNYIVTLNGVIQSPGIYSISNNNTFQFTVPDLTPSPNTILNVTEIFSTSLSSNYISSIQYWTSASSVPASVFPLTGNPSLSASSNYYIVTVDGIMQSPSSYTITPSAYTISFAPDAVPSANLPIQVFYLPGLLNPYVWTFNLTTPTNILSLSSNSVYISNPYKTFLVNIGGVYQGSLNYVLDVVNNQLVFDSVLPTNTNIFVTYTDTLQSVYNPLAYTPANVSIDSNYNIWVSLFNDHSILKFDPNFNLLFNTSPASLLGINSAANYPGDTKVNTDIVEEDYLLKPPTVETDKNNNCWATYSFSLCSLLVKFDTYGNPLTAITLPNNSVPAALAIDNNNNVWVSNSYETSAIPGNIQQYNGTNYTLMNTVTGIPRPGELSFNRAGNLWFTHSIRGIGYYDIGKNTTTLYYNDPSETSSRFTLLTAVTGVLYSQSSLISSLSSTIDYSIQSMTYTFSWTTSTYTVSGNQIYNFDEDFTGLAVDVYDRLWVIDAPYNSTYILTSAVPQSITINTLNSNTPNFISDPVFREIQIVPNNTVSYYTNPNTSFTVTNSGNYLYRSAQATGDWTGNKWYQKYTNFQLLTSALLSGTSAPFAINDFSNPYQIKRINESFNTAAYYKSLALPENLQENTVLFDQFFPAVVGTGYLSANEDVGQVTYERIANFVQNHSDVDTCLTDQLLNLAKFVDIDPSTYATLYPSDIKNMLDISSISKNRLLGFPDLSGNYFNNIIDWNSNQTLLNPTLSTFKDWYGDNGIIESSFRYLLTKNLFLNN
jgi:hypothetical protein